MINTPKDAYTIYAERDQPSGLLSIYVYLILNGKLNQNSYSLLIDPKLDHSILNSEYLHEFWGSQHDPQACHDLTMQFVCSGYEFFAELRCNPPEGTPDYLSNAVGVLGKDFLQKYQWKVRNKKKCQKVEILRLACKEHDYDYFMCMNFCGYDVIIRKEDYSIYESQNQNLLLQKNERLSEVKSLFDEEDWEVSVTSESLEEAQGKVLVCPDCGKIMQSVAWEMDEDPLPIGSKRITGKPDYQVMKNWRKLRGEHRVFQCVKCGYSAEVQGELYFDDGCHTLMETKVCRNCKILFEDLYEFPAFSILLFKKQEVVDLYLAGQIIPDEITGCLRCGGHSYHKWTSKKAQCPKCKGFMRLTKGMKQ